MAESEVDLTKTYDAVVVGSGAAGGMAAHVLTTHGLKVLLLEAGKKLPIEKELRSMEWPYDNRLSRIAPARPPFSHLQRIHHPQSALRSGLRKSQASAQLYRRHATT